METPAEVIRYTVHYGVLKEGWFPTVTTVVLREGYSTFEDIRKIISIRRGVSVEEILVQGLVLV